MSYCDTKTRLCVDVQPRKRGSAGVTAVRHSQCALKKYCAQPFSTYKDYTRCNLVLHPVKLQKFSKERELSDDFNRLSLYKRNSQLFRFPRNSGGIFHTYTRFYRKSMIFNYSVWITNSIIVTYFL